MRWGTLWWGKGNVGDPCVVLEEGQTGAGERSRARGSFMMREGTESWDTCLFSSSELIKIKGKLRSGTFACRRLQSYGNHYGVLKGPLYSVQPEEM